MVRGQGGPCARFALPPSSFYNHGRAQVRPISLFTLQSISSRFILFTCHTGVWLFVAHCLCSEASAYRSGITDIVRITDIVSVRHIFLRSQIPSENTLDSWTKKIRHNCHL